MGKHRVAALNHRVRNLSIGAATAAILVGSVAAASASTSSPTASCDAPVYDGSNFTQHCVIPQVTQTVVGPTTTETVTQTVTATPSVTAPVTSAVPTSVSPTPTSAAPSITPTPTSTLPVGWTHVAFEDNFSGSSVDTTKWNVRNNSWASNELSIDTNRANNVVVVNGILTERAQREQYTAFSTTRSYTSAYLDSIGKFSVQYGRWEIRAKLPASKGMWPAFWLRGNKGLGELDSMEAVGGVGTTVQTIHQSTNGGQGKLGHEDKAVADLTAWHVYVVEREPGVVRWYIDDRLVFTVTTATASWLDTTFNEPMNMRLNLQVGGSMPTYYGKNVDATSTLPADFAIDYVRVLTR